MQLAERLRARMAGGEVALGTFVVELRTPAVARILEQGGFDFMLIDTEHGCFDPATVAQHIQAGKQRSVCPLVRVPGPEPAEIKRVLDAGAEGIMVPMCQSLEEVQLAVQSSKYPPVGRRGAHFTRPHTEYSNPPDMGAYMEQANRNLLTIIQIETLPAVGLIDEIAAMPGVDMLYLGPGDLSIAMERPGEIAHPDIIAVVEQVGAACRQHGKIAGCHFGNPEVLPEYKRLGVRFVGYGAAVRMLQAGVAQMGAGALQALDREVP